MKKIVCTLLPILAIALVLGMTSAVAQNSPDDVYAVGYYSGANVVGNPDTTVRVINDGSAGEADLCAAFYVFDNSQELQACCSCDVTADGIISESVNKNLLYNVLTANVNHAGVIRFFRTQILVPAPRRRKALEHQPLESVDGSPTSRLARLQRHRRSPKPN